MYSKKYMRCCFLILFAGFQVFWLNYKLIFYSICVLHILKKSLKLKQIINNIPSPVFFSSVCSLATKSDI